MCIRDRYIIYAARTRPVKRLNDGTLHMELYTVEGYLTDLPTKDGFSYLDFYLRKNNFLTYDGESYKRINSGNKTITWKDGSTSPYGERKTTIAVSYTHLDVYKRQSHKIVASVKR